MQIAYSSQALTAAECKINNSFGLPYSQVFHASAEREGTLTLGGTCPPLPNAGEPEDTEDAPA